MLPSSKRPARNPDASGETIRTGDFEVVHVSPAPASAKRRSERPMFEPPVDDEERTLLFSGSPRTMLPPRSAQQAPMPVIAKAGRAPNMNLRGLSRGHEAKPQDMRGAVRRPVDAEDRTILRPTSTLPPALQKSASVAPPSPPAPAAKPVSARPPAMMPTPYVSMKPSAPPVELNARGGSDRKSDPGGDPPGSVITARTRIVRAKSSLSWAVALMAIGAFVGLGAAVVARGDADSVLDAAASVMDPSHSSAAHASAAAVQGAVIPSFVDTTAKKTAANDSTPTSGSCLSAGETTVSAPVVNTPAGAHPSDAKAVAKADAKETKVASIAGADPKEAVRPAPPRAAPVAYAAPVHHAWHAAPARSESSSTGGWLANVTPAGAGAPIARPSHSKAGAGGDSFESAAAADALAKAQLEASLR